MFEERHRNHDTYPSTDLSGNTEGPFPSLGNERMTIALDALRQQSRKTIRLLDAFYRAPGTRAALDFAFGFLEIVHTFDAVTSLETDDPETPLKHIHPADTDRILADDEFFNNLTIITQSLKIALRALEKHMKEGDLRDKAGMQEILGTIDQIRSESPFSISA